MTKKEIIITEEIYIDGKFAGKTAKCIRDGRGFLGYMLPIFVGIITYMQIVVWS
jgi:hypothetical protein